MPSQRHEHVCISGELRCREYDKEVGKGKDTVKMPVAEIDAGEIRSLDSKAAPDSKAPSE